MFSVNVNSLCPIYHTQNTPRRVDATPSLGIDVDRASTLGAFCVMAKRRINHGMGKTPEYKAWLAIKERCLNSNCKHYHNYGGRGITISKEWENNFPAFFAHIGVRPSKDFSIDRIDNNGNYEPGNIRWATRSIQSQNKRSAGAIEWEGHIYTYAELGKKFGISGSHLSNKIKRGFTVEEIAELPKKPTRKKLTDGRANRDKKSIQFSHLISFNGANDPRVKKILQYSLDGRLLNEFPSIKAACLFLRLKSLNTAIGLACVVKNKTAYGYKWKFKKDVTTLVPHTFSNIN